MRLRVASIVATIFFLLCGLALLMVGIFAFSLGLDHNSAWGTGRTLATVFGLISCLAAFSLHCRRRLQRAILVSSAYIGGLRAVTSLKRFVQRCAHFISRLVQRSTFIQKAHSIFQKRDDIFVLMGVFLCVVIALWFITAGRMTAWTPSSYYFDQLADAFLAGQVSLLDQPTAELLAMPNPYDWRARLDQQVSFAWDVSLYKDKYYLYWGPVPALMAAGVKIIRPVRLDDATLVLFFYAGLILFVALTLAHMRRRLFSDSPAWLILPLVLFGGLSAPMMWLVNRPNVYETAITGGQFFLLGGLFCLLRAMDSKSQSRGWLLTAGFAWGAAVGCRLNLAFSIGFFVFVFALYRLKTSSFNQWISSMIYLTTPLLLWAGGLGWYNLARFGNILETGHRYQLTGPALPPRYEDVASIQYLLPSLYSYLIRPPVFLPGEFPFVFIPFVKESMWPFFIRLPEHYYYPEPVAGLLMIAPAVWLTGLPVFGWLRTFKFWLREEPHVRLSRPVDETILWILFIGGSILLFLPLLVFISTSLRYLVDVLPVITLLTALSLWWGLDFFRDRPFLRRMITLTAVILMLIGVLIGTFSGFTLGTTPFETRNQALYDFLKSFFQ